MGSYRVLIRVMSIACCVHLTVRRSEAQTCQAIAPQYETFAASKLVDRYKPGEDFPDNQDDLQSYAIDAARIGIVVLGLGIIMWFCGCCRLCCTCHRLDRNGPCQPWECCEAKPWRTVAWGFLVLYAILAVAFYITALSKVASQSKAIQDTPDSLNTLTVYLNTTLTSNIECVILVTNKVEDNATALFNDPAASSADKVTLNTISSACDAITDVLDRSTDDGLLSIIDRVAEDIEKAHTDASDYSDDAGGYNKLVLGIVLAVLFVCLACGMCCAACNGKFDTIRGKYVKTCFFSECFLFFMLVIFIVATVYGVVVALYAGYCADPLGVISDTFDNPSVGSDEYRFVYYLECHEYTSVKRVANWPWTEEQTTISNALTDINTAIATLSGVGATSLDTTSLKESITILNSVLTGTNGTLGPQGVLGCPHIDEFLQAFAVDFCKDLFDPTALLFEMLVCMAVLMFLVEVAQKWLRREPLDRSRVGPAVDDDQEKMVEMTTVV